MRFNLCKERLGLKSLAGLSRPGSLAGRGEAEEMSPGRPSARPGPILLAWDQPGFPLSALPGSRASWER